ncbi:PREDICTED: transmembrane protein 150A-like [Amphimedon queenslandica]|uniref:CWH43-like N-terminal domain-containing protein n=1 Tax=Amphimedon queenslandica TaxID=400682 RepID=A0A1X7TXC1_AMPQE|nr:PREDICTED: transmembrane protein 150A-like [Amphimedon queenslandica]|eukprot:XP_011406556.2 PREDICTED: transmembrane protein 150A-like [Amphimedon queenslandica]
MVSLSFLLKLGVIQALLTVIVSYILGRTHIDSIPMISDCGMYKPERYVFRLGSVSAAMLMGVASVGVYTSSSQYRNKVALCLAVTGSIGLGVLGSVNIMENWTLHTVSAIIFLFSFGAYINLFTFLSRRSISSLLFKLRITLALINTITLIIFFILHYDFDRLRVSIAILEWVFFFNALIFQWTLSNEFKSTQLIWTNTESTGISTTDLN